MFKRRFSDGTTFSDNTFLWDDKTKDFDSLILVVYDKNELLNFLKMYVEDINILICIFNQKLYSSLTFLNGLHNLFLLDASRIKSDISNDLKSYFKDDFNMKEKLGLASFIDLHTDKNINIKLMRLINSKGA